MVKEKRSLVGDDSVQLNISEINNESEPRSAMSELEQLIAKSNLNVEDVIKLISPDTVPTEKKTSKKKKRTKVSELGAIVKEHPISETVIHEEVNEKPHIKKFELEKPKVENPEPLVNAKVLYEPADQLPGIGNGVAEEKRPIEYGVIKILPKEGKRSILQDLPQTAEQHKEKIRFENLDKHLKNKEQLTEAESQQLVEKQLKNSKPKKQKKKQQIISDQELGISFDPKTGDVVNLMTGKKINWSKLGYIVIGYDK